MTDTDEGHKIDTERQRERWIEREREREREREKDSKLVRVSVQRKKPANRKK